MSELGRMRVATEAECAEVRNLASGGASVRAIAEAVFGDCRFRGRVERILKESRALVARLPEPVEDGGAVETVPIVRVALTRYLRRVQRGEVQPSVGEMVKLLDLERRLQAFAALEQANALTRE